MQRGLSKRIMFGNRKNTIVEKMHRMLKTHVQLHVEHTHNATKTYNNSHHVLPFFHISYSYFFHTSVLAILAACCSIILQRHPSTCTHTLIYVCMYMCLYVWDFCTYRYSIVRNSSTLRLNEQKEIKMISQ